MICDSVGSSCASIRNNVGLLVISTGKYMCVPSINACDYDRVKLKDDRRALEMLQRLRVKNGHALGREVDMRVTTVCPQDWK